MAAYVDNDALYEEICKSLERNELTPEALRMLNLIVVRSNKRLQYVDESDREDCISFAMMEILKYWNRFKPHKSRNAFAYFTQTAKNGFAKGWDILHPKKHKGTISLSGSSRSPDGIFTV